VAGKKCRAAATESELCFFHSNPNKAVELGRIGGRKNRHGSADSGEPLLLIETAKQVRDTVGRLVNDMSLGKLSPRLAAAMASLLNLQLRAIEATTGNQEFPDWKSIFWKPNRLQTVHRMEFSAENPDPKKMPTR